MSLKLTTYCTVAVCLKKWLQPGKSQGPFQLSCNIFAVKKVSARQALQIQKTESGLKFLTTMALASHLTVLSANSPQPPFFTQELLLGKIHRSSCTKEVGSTYRSPDSCGQLHSSSASCGAEHRLSP